MKALTAARYHLRQSLRSEGILSRDFRKFKVALFLYVFGMAVTFVSSYIKFSGTGERSGVYDHQVPEYTVYLFLLLSSVSIHSYLQRFLNEEYVDFLRLHGMTLGEVAVVRYFEGLVGGLVVAGFLGVAATAFLIAWRGFTVQTLLGLLLFGGIYALSNAAGMAVVCWLLALGQHKVLRVLAAVLLSGGMVFFFVSVNLGLVPDLNVNIPDMNLPPWGPWHWAVSILGSPRWFYSLILGLGLLLLLAAATALFVVLGALGYGRYAPSANGGGRRRKRPAVCIAAWLAPASLRHFVWKDLTIVVRDRRKWIPLLISNGLGLFALLVPFQGRSIRADANAQMLTVFILVASLAFVANAFVGLSALSHDAPVLVWLKQSPVGLTSYVVAKIASLLCVTLPIGVLISSILAMRLHLPYVLVLVLTLLVFTLFAPMSTAIGTFFFTPTQTGGQASAVAPMAMLSLFVAQAILLYGGIVIYLAAEKLRGSELALLSAILVAFWLLIATALTQLGLRRLRDRDLPL